MDDCMVLQTVEGLSGLVGALLIASAVGPVRAALAEGLERLGLAGDRPGRGASHRESPDDTRFEEVANSVSEAVDKLHLRLTIGGLLLAFSVLMRLVGRATCG